jgi:Ca-activated chloride channel family protein
MRAVPVPLRAALPFALALLLFARADAQQATFRGGVELVNIGVTVTDRDGRLVSDLTREDFELLEDGRPQTVRYFAGAAAPAPDLHIGILLDVSGSMEDDIGFTRTAAIRFLRTMGDAQDVTVVDFDTEVRAARFSQPEFPRLVERIRTQPVQGETALYDAIGLYLDGAAEQQGRKVMLLYTDGGDTRSAIHLNELVDLVKASDTTIYAIGVTDRRSARAWAGQQMVLRRIVDPSGGRVFFPPSLRQLDEVYSEIVAEIRAQYTLGYVSANDRADGTWRKVDVKVKRPDGGKLKLRARDGYYAPLRGAAAR